MKKVLITISIFAMLLCFNLTSFAAYLGDVDGNGKITASDARTILRVSAKLDKLDDSKFNFADVNNDKKITASDARSVLRMSARLESLKELTTKETTTKAPTTKPPVTDVQKNPTVKADKNKVQIYRGTSEIINVEVLNIDEYVLDVELRTNSDAELSSDIKCEVAENGKKAKITLTVNEVFIGEKTMNLYVRVKKPGAKLATTYVSIPVNVCYETQEVFDGLSVTYLKDRDFVYDEEKDEYILRFGLTSSANKYLSTYGRLSMRIVNSDDIVVYSKTYDVTPDDFSNWSNLFVTKYLFSMKIPASELIVGDTENGKIYMEFITPWIYFPEAYLSVSNLPARSILDDCSVELPELPIELTDYTYSGFADYKFRVDDITYEFEENSDGTVDLRFYFSGEKTFDNDGDNYSSRCYISYKLYDSDGYVVKSDSVRSDALKVGEKQKNIESYKIYNLQPGTYRLELLDSD